MVELLCVVEAYVYIEQGINMVNVLKVNYKGHRVTLFEVSMVFLLNLNLFVTLFLFSVANI